jgi:tetratricopeptide (TPR) repeat protein
MPNYVNLYENIGFVYAEWGKLISDEKEQEAIYKTGLKEIDTALLIYRMEKPTLHQNKIFILEQLAQIQGTDLEKKEIMTEIVETVEDKKIKTLEDLQRQLYYLNILEDKEGLVRVGKKLVNDHPKDCGMLFEMSKNYFSSKKYEFSLELLNLYLKANPQDLSAASNKGMLLEIMGKKKEALSVYEEILAKDPKHKHTRVLYNNLKGIN